MALFTVLIINLILLCGVAWFAIWCLQKIGFLIKLGGSLSYGNGKKDSFKGKNRKL